MRFVVGVELRVVALAARQRVQVCCCSSSKAVAARLIGRVHRRYTEKRTRVSGFSVSRLVTMERPAPIRGTWVMLRIGRKAVQSHKQKEPVYEENKICRVGCPCGDDRRSGSGARGGNTVLGSYFESRGVGSEAGQETGPGGTVAILL